MKNVDAAYIAGLIDGEGCVDLTTPRAKKNGKRYAKLRVRITQNTLPVLEWVALTAGVGRVYKGTKIYGTSKTAIHKYIVVCRQAARLLAEVRPYMKIKGTRVDEVLGILAEIKTRPTKSVELSTAFHARKKHTPCRNLTRSSGV